MIEVSPEFDPLTGTWFLVDPPIDAPTVRAVAASLPGGYRLHPTYRLDGAPIVIRPPQEHEGDAFHKYRFSFGPPLATAKRLPPNPAPVHDPEPAKVAKKRKPFKEIVAEAAAVAERVAELYASQMKINDIASAVQSSRARVLKIVDAGRNNGDWRFSVPRPRARPNTRKVLVVGRLAADGGLEVLSAVVDDSEA